MQQRGRERIFGTNVLEIAVFIYTNKRSYDIIRIVFGLSSLFTVVPWSAWEFSYTTVNSG